MLKFFSVVIFFVSISQTIGQTLSIKKSGLIWIAPIIIDQRAIKLKNSSCCTDGEYSFQINNGAKYIARKDSSICISNLSLDESHLLKIYCDGKVVSSFKFSFKKENSSELCLWLNDLYCTWSLWPLNDSKHLCKCRSAG